MFDFLFGWRRASKCKKVIKRARCRLKLLKIKMNAIVRQSREDLAELTKYGHQQIAFSRVEQLINDEDSTLVYELLDHFCEFILVHLSYIRRHKDCPNDINEAVSSLMYASARCGDVPELRSIRKLFGHRYGDKFATAALELRQGNLVNPQLQEKLSPKWVSDDQKYRVIDEIARDYCIQPELLALEYYPDFQLAQVNENNGQLVSREAPISDRIRGSEMLPLEVEETERSIICVDSSSKNSLSKSRDYDTSNTSALISTVQKYPPIFLATPLHKNAEKVKNFAEEDYLTASGLEDKGKILALTSSKESLPPFCEEVIFYLDDIEEFQFSTSKDQISFQDQRIFKFRSSGVPRRKKIEFACDRSDMEQDESLLEKSSRRSSRKIRRTAEKSSRRRSTSLEKQGIMDIECMAYYYKPGRSPAHKHSSQNGRKRQNRLLERSPEYSAYSPKRSKQHSSLEMERILLSRHSENGTNRRKYSADCRADNTTTAITKLYPPRWDQINCQTNEKTKEIKAEASESLASFATSSASRSRFAASLTRTETEATCSRAATMPPELPKECKDRTFRTHSCPSQYPNHVHPKLPDYDELAATFMALKRERLQNKPSCSDPQLNRGGIVH